LTTSSRANDPAPRGAALLAALTLTLNAGLASATEHPFILWTREEAASIRRAIETEAWASNAYQRLCTEKDPGQPVRNLFKYAVFGDTKARDTEKQYLLTFIGAPVDGREWSCNYMHALRYDTLYHELSPGERIKLEDTFRVHVRYQIENGNRNRGKWNWLPNMQWPRTQGMHMMAVALADTNLVEAIAASPGGWRYYMDDYISDGQFYNEEFGKYHSVVGEMFLWCRGCERLGLNRLGYGYTGRNGATLRRYIRSLQTIGYPRVDTGSERPAYPRVSMGDARGAGLQQLIVPGHGPGGGGGTAAWSSSNMNGRDHRDQIIGKMRERLWFELSHVLWPEDGWDYFLAASRLPQDDRYVPSLLWGCPPIDPAQARPPSAPSGLYPERGFSFLRSDESPSYWESPAPAVALQFSQPYAHGVADSFTILGFAAFNRLLYVNRQVSGGYAGTDPGWSNGARSHSTVIVDGREPRRCGPAETRNLFRPSAKFASARSTGVYDGVDQTRAIALTREYALDVFALSSDLPRAYLWLLQGTGHACPDNPGDWAPSKLMTGLMYDVREVKSFVAESSPWAITMMQQPSTRLRAAGEPGGAGRTEQQIGVKVRMLGSPCTIASHGFGPMRPGDLYRLNDGDGLPGEPVIAVYRQATRTAFVALHEPFDRVPRIRSFRRIAQTDDAVFVAVSGEGGVDDRIALRWGPDAGKPLTLGDSRENVTFTGFAFFRIGPESVTVHGNAAAFRLAANGPARLVTDEGTRTGTAAGGFIVYPPDAGAAPPAGSAQQEPEPPQTAPVSMRWDPPVAAIPLGGAKEFSAVLQNLSSSALRGGVRVTAGQFAAAEPAAFDLTGLAPGCSTTLSVRISSSDTNATGAGAVRMSAGEASSFVLQPTPLPLSCGVTVEHREDWPRRFVKRITAPRYIVEYDYHNSVAAALMLDGDGRRRDGDYPALWTETTNATGRTAWRKESIGGYSPFNPNQTRREGTGLFLAEMGQHPHGYVSPLYYHFTEQWIYVGKRQGAASDQIAFECGPGADRRAQTDLRAIDWNRNAIRSLTNGAAVCATFMPGGSDTGLACFFPPEAKWLDGRAAQPASTAMAFTWCRWHEFAALVESWISFKAPAVKPQQQGEVRN
jgi:hypothetical protein